ncbi:hypothetical protein [Streptomyces bauhiniae]|uniref:hypothetical protein n=1 Tax=Streptomyces bauhiniae TaxID=2340725 RepID=UPI0035E2E7B3
MTLRTGVLILVPALGSLVADALCPGTDETGMSLRAGVLILVPALGSPGSRRPVSLY